MRLISVNVFQCRLLEPQVFRDIVELSSGTLQSIRACGCARLTSHTAELIYFSCHHLQAFHLNACRNVDREVSSRIQEGLEVRNRLLESYGK